MDPALAALLRSWTFDPWLIVPMEAFAVLYLRGWWQLYRQMPQRFGVWRLVSFQAGLFVLFLALASPLEALAEVLLQAHMVQHLVLMMVAPACSMALASVTISSQLLPPSTRSSIDRRKIIMKFGPTASRTRRTISTGRRMRFS